jgi:superfamily II DNA or RNA helicase
VEKVYTFSTNEVFTYVSCEPSVGRELSEHFCFFVPGYKFMPSYKSGAWDGKIRLFNRQTCLIYKGLVHELKRFCDKQGYQFIPEDTKLPAKFTEEHIQEIVKERYPLTAKGTVITPREHQAAAIAEALSNDRKILVSPTASGKSLIAYIIIRMLQDMHKAKVLLVVPTTGLVHQMMNDFDDYSSKDKKWNANKECHLVYAGQPKSVKGSNVTITTWQSVFRQPKAFFADYDAVIIDECHLAQANSMKAILEKMDNTKYRFGMTGTMHDPKCHQWVLEGLLGRCKQIVTTKQLMEKNLIANLKIHCTLLKYPDDVRQAAKGLKYAKEMDFLAQNEKRNEFIVKLAERLKGNTLVLFQYVDKHGKPLYNSISKGSKNAHYIAGSVKGDERLEIVNEVEASNNNVIVASYGTFSTGMSIRNLHNIVFASPYKSKFKVLQSIGRGLRLDDGKSLATLFDIADDLSWKKTQNHTLKHFTERVKLYNKESFNYKFSQVKI